jgi:hypothetical protein
MPVFVGERGDHLLNLLVEWLLVSMRTAACLRATLPHPLNIVVRAGRPMVRDLPAASKSARAHSDRQHIQY